MQLHIGKLHTLTVGSLAEASRVYLEKREEWGEAGAYTAETGTALEFFPTGRINVGKLRYKVTYNGYVWKGDKILVKTVFRG
jgi:hypothetical protein